MAPRNPSIHAKGNTMAGCSNNLMKEEVRVSFNLERAPLPSNPAPSAKSASGVASTAKFMYHLDFKANTKYCQKKRCKL